MAKKESKKVLSGIKPVKLITDEVLGTESIVPPTEDVNDPERMGFLIIEGLPSNTAPLSSYQTEFVVNCIKIFAVVVAAIICLYLGIKVFG